MLLGLLDSSVAERFWPKVEKIPFHECWVWTGSLNNRGYGILSVSRRPQLAHRVSWTLSNGAIPEKALVLHRCDNRACVRPEHLFLGDFSDNLRDADSKSRGVRGQRLTVEEARTIKRARIKGVPISELSARFGVSKTHICGIARGRIWRSA